MTFEYVGLGVCDCFGCHFGAGSLLLKGGSEAGPAFSSNARSTPGRSTVKKEELALELARSAGIPVAEAADQVDSVVHEILKKLRQGKPATVPGLGKLTPEQQQKVRYSGFKIPEPPQQGAQKSKSTRPVRGKR